MQKDKYISNDNQSVLEMKYLEGTNNVVITLSDINTNIGEDLFAINVEKLREGILEKTFYKESDGITTIINKYSPDHK